MNISMLIHLYIAMAAFMLHQRSVDAPETIWDYKAKDIYYGFLIEKVCTLGLVYGDFQCWEPLRVYLFEKNISLLLSHPHWFISFLLSLLAITYHLYHLLFFYMLFIFYLPHWKPPCGQGFLFVVLLYPRTLTNACHINGHPANIYWMNKHGFYGKKIVPLKCVGAFLFHGQFWGF